MKLLVWGARRLSFGNRAIALGFLVNFVKAGGAGLHRFFLGRAFIGEMLFGSANHAQIVLLPMFLFLWEELAVGSENV
jgi:TM2 domain-containing membrane protein YozV